LSLPISHELMTKILFVSCRQRHPAANRLELPEALNMPIHAANRCDGQTLSRAAAAQHRRCGRKMQNGRC
jgi:hypothetical protein